MKESDTVYAVTTLDRHFMDEPLDMQLFTQADVNDILAGKFNEGYRAGWNKSLDYHLQVSRYPGVEKVISSGPATVVIFQDSSKSVVKCDDDDVFDWEKGIALALCKRLLPSKEYSKIFGEWFEQAKGWEPGYSEVEFDSHVDKIWSWLSEMGETLGVKNDPKPAEELIDGNVENLKWNAE